jgi:enoyl-[acyl-carrier protein] reductase I
MNEFQNKNNWALILGGSSGLGLASAKKLAAHGMHICIVHRSPRHFEAALAKEIEAITAMGVQCLVFNKDALKEAKRNEILQALQTALGDNGQLKTLVHSIAKGNLKPMVYTIGQQRYMPRNFLPKTPAL